MKLLKERRGLDLGNYFFDMAPKAQATKIADKQVGLQQKASVQQKKSSTK